jgi:hypothetical protein
MDEYTVINLSDKGLLNIKSFHNFNNAKDAACFLWGDFMGKALIYKNNELAFFAHLYPDVTNLQKYLEGNIRYPTMPRDHEI